VLGAFWDRILGPVLGTAQDAQKKERQLTHFQGSVRTKEGITLEAIWNFGSINIKVTHFYRISENHIYNEVTL
jgi:hypothetical protein